MNKLTALVLSVLIIFSVAACMTKSKQKPVKVKCPACGYEFEAPPYGR